MVAGFLNAPMCLLQPNEILSEATERFWDPLCPSRHEAIVQVQGLT